MEVGGEVEEWIVKRNLERTFCRKYWRLMFSHTQASQALARQAQKRHTRDGKPQGRTSFPSRRNKHTKSDARSSGSSIPQYQQ